MFAIIIACHGRLAHELMQSSFIIFGEQADVYAVDYLADEDAAQLKAKFTTVLKQLSSDKEVLFLTDLYGGQPFLTAQSFVKQEPGKYQLLSGVNLAMLLESYGDRQTINLDYLAQIGQEAVVAYGGRENV